MVCSTDHVRECPVCGRVWSIKRILPMDVRNHPKFTLSWLNSHGFKYIEERLEVDCVVE
jgi:hypothetical protein